MKPFAKPIVSSELDKKYILPYNTLLFTDIFRFSGNFRSSLREVAVVGTRI